MTLEANPLGSVGLLPYCATIGAYTSFRRTPFGRRSLVQSVMHIPEATPMGRLNSTQLKDLGDELASLSSPMPA